MKINFKKFLKIPLRGVSKKEIRPRRDWILIVSLFFIGLLVVAVIHFFVFKNLRAKVENVDEFETASSVLLDQRKIDLTYEFIEKRRTGFETATRVRTTDPAN